MSITIFSILVKMYLPTKFQGNRVEQGVQFVGLTTISMTLHFAVPSDHVILHPNFSKTLDAMKLCPVFLPVQYMFILM